LIQLLILFTIHC